MGCQGTLPTYLIVATHVSRRPLWNSLPRPLQEFRCCFLLQVLICLRGPMLTSSFLVKFIEITFDDVLLRYEDIHMDRIPPRGKQLPKRILQVQLTYRRLLKKVVSQSSCVPAPLAFRRH